MRKKCIIHIGMHKTGSSSIQESLSKCKNLNHFHYANLLTSNHSGKIFSIFSDSSKNLHTLRRRGMTDDEIQTFINNAKRMLISNCMDLKCDTMILSGEGIIKLSLEELKKFKLFLENYFEKITIVAYIRTPISFIHSAFQQQIKEGVDTFNIKNSFPKYRQKFEKFDMVFGKKNVVLWKFDPKSFKSNDVVMDFCNRLGIKLDSKYISRSNETVLKETLCLLYIYRKYGQGFGIGRHVIRQNNLLIDALQSLGKSKIQFSKGLIKNVLCDIKDDVKWMEKRLGQSLNEKIVGIKDTIDKEEDLLSVEPDTVNALKTLVTDEYIPCGMKGDTLKEIAALVHCLRFKLTSENLEKKKNKIVEIKNKDGNEFVLRGDKGFLFLRGGNHRIIDFFTAKKKPAMSSVTHFSHNILKRSKYCKERKIIYKHFVFPEKIYALKHLTDLSIKSLYKAYYMDSKEVNSHCVYFDFEEHEAKEYYTKTDTHLNLYGNLKLLKSIITEHDADIQAYINKVKKNVGLKTDFVGDIGNKLIPNESELIMRYSVDESIRTYTNGLQKGNNGKLNILINTQALYKKKVLIFGDSFFYTILRDLSNFYTEVIFCRSPFFHEEIAELCSPDIIYTGNAERYLSNVSLDESRYDFFMWPIIEDRGLSPDIGFGNAMKKVFNLQKFNMSQINNER